MKRFIFGSLVVGAGLAATRYLFARTVSSKPVPDSTSFDAIEAYVEGQMHRLNIPGVSLATVEDDKIVHLRGFGRARPGGEAPTPQTPFFIGSLTKSFTALAVMQLVEAGKIDLGCCVASCSSQPSKLLTSSPHCSCYAAGLWSLSAARPAGTSGGFASCSR